MGVARWRWSAVLVVILVAGCLPRPPLDLPASFYSSFGGTSVTFTPQPPPAGATGQAVAAALWADDPIFRRRAVPVFGVIDCHGDPRCRPGPGGADGEGARTVWVVLYPDCNEGQFVNVAGVDIDVGWVVVDAVQGLAGGYAANAPCPIGP